ncbi:hypothetical protein N7532_009592, partial [Penicillium argentinense]
DSSLRVRRKAAPTSLSVENHERFYPDKTFIQRRFSNSTDFDDTDIETSDSDEESLRQSLQSFAYDSNTSISTPDLPNPEHVSKNRVHTHLDKSMVRGPEGPHLFRDSLGSSIYEPSTAEIDLYFERSPLQSEFSRSIDTPRRFPFSPKTPKALTTVHPDVSHVSEEEIRAWKPNQVAHWLHIAGYNDAVIEKFLINDITGTVLLSIQSDDLKELSIHSFGMRHQIMASIDHLKNTMATVPPVPPTPESFMTQSIQQKSSIGRSSPEHSFPKEHSLPEERHTPRRHSYAMSVSPNGEILSNHVFGNQITPGESVSIVGIEQRLPKPHNCSRGEKCSKFRKYQRHLEQIFAEHPNAVLHDGMIIIGSPGNPETARDLLRPKSNSEPSVVASSDIFGPAPGPMLSEKALNGVEKLDPQETIRNFLNYQHVDAQPMAPPLLDTSNLPPPEEPFAGLTPPNAQPSGMATNLRNLPKLTIPVSPNTEEMTTAVTSNRSMTPTHVSQAYGSPTAVQQYGPFTQARNIDVYRQGTPFTEVDVPVTAIPNGPIARDASQSVPPDMQYGTLFPPYRDPLMRSASTRPQQNSQPLRRVREDKPLTPIETPEDLIRSPRQRPHGHSSSQSSLSSDPNVTHSGYLKHKKNRLFRHEWKDAHVTLRDTKVTLHESEQDAHRISRALDVIDVDDYAVACSSLATSSKVTAAIKRNILRKQNRMPNGSEGAAFQFSFIPAHKEGDRKALFGKNALPRHDFVDDTAEGRGEWVRKLLLAKAEKRARDNGEQMLINGYNVI